MDMVKAYGFAMEYHFYFQKILFFNYISGKALPINRLPRYLNG